MAEKLPESIRQILEQPYIAHIVTLMPDGSPHVTPVWVDTDGEFVYINTVEGRRKTRNMHRDSRVALSVLDPQDPYQAAVQIRGKVVEMTPQGAEEHADRLAQKYIGQERYTMGAPGEVRLQIKIQPEWVKGPTNGG